MIEIAKTVTEKLTPLLMLGSNIFKLACAGAILGLDIVVYTQHSEANYSLIGLGIDCAVL
jgi:hypothetical protein